MNHPAILDAVIARSGLTIHRKSRSPLMWAAYFLLVMPLWNPRFMSKFWTTIGKRCYAPHWPLEADDWTVLAHEGKHVDQHERHGLGHSIGYLFPQILAAPALLAAFVLGWLFIAWLPLHFLAGWQWPISHWWLLAFVTAPFGAPWPAKRRAATEAEAYTMTVVADILLYGRGHVMQPGYVQWLAQYFGKSYYWPVWGQENRERVAGDVVGKALLATSTAPHGSDPYVLDMIAVIKRADAMPANVITGKFN